MIAVALIVLGAAFLIYEAFSPGAFLVIPGTVMIILGIIGSVYPDIMMSWWSPVIAVVIAVPVTVLTVKAYQRLAVPGPPETTVTESLIGKQGTVTSGTRPGTLKGKVKIGSEIWSADSEEELETGTPVVVVRSEGVHIFVRRLTEE